MRPVNIYALSRIKSEKAFNTAAEQYAGAVDDTWAKRHEIESLRLLCDALMAAGAGVEDLAEMYFSFTIPRIGKEFDVLKIGADACLNIELKSAPVSKEKIRKQLVQNRYYLSFLPQEPLMYTVVTTPFACWTLTDKGKLAEADISEVAAAVRRVCAVPADIDKLFHPSNFLISPPQEPGKFLQGDYFLTPPQSEIKKDLIRKVKKADGCSLFHLTGKPGTGKTLLLYDIARGLVKRGQVLLLHCGGLSAGQQAISDGVDGLTIARPDDVKDLTAYRFVLADEAQRLTAAQFETLTRTAKECGQALVLATDPEQVLTRAEEADAIAARIDDLPLAGEYRLRARLRSNHEVTAFAAGLADLTRRPTEKLTGGSVKVYYAGTRDEATRLALYLQEQGNTVFHYGGWTAADEYDKVAVIMDSDFYYEGNILKCRRTADGLLAEKLLYQAVTRAREEVAVLVVEDEELFETVQSILQGHQ